jgi:hypothetical protein
MTVPLWARSVAALVGGLLVLTVWANVIKTLIVPRPLTHGLAIRVTRAVNKMFRLAASSAADYHGRDRVRSGQASAILLASLAAWLGGALIGFWLLMWPLVRGGIGTAFSTAGSSMFTLGFAEPSGAPPAVVVFAAAVTGLVIVTLQIAYLPSLYAAFNRRETEVTLLNARAGVPSWGPELLARTHYALGTGVSSLDTLPGLYAQWERWAADVTESHTTYIPLVRFRSPRPLSSWVTALLAVLDSAALYLALSPGAAPEVPARLCLRSGFVCFREVAQAMGFAVPDEPDPGGRRRPGRTSPAGGSPTSRPRTRWRPRSTPSRRCGPARAARATRVSRRFGRPSATRSGRPIRAMMPPGPVSGGRSRRRPGRASRLLRRARRTWRPLPLFASRPGHAPRR